MKELWVFTGPVSAGKSEGALRIIHRLARQKTKTLHIRPLASRRDEEKNADENISFAKTKAGSEIDCLYLSRFDNLDAFLIGDPDILWFDEIHFWEIGLKDPIVAQKLHELRKKYMIIISGIGASTSLDPICPSMGFLLQTADRIFSELADCDWCATLNSATRNVYIGGGSVGTVKLGGEESFRPACPQCWNKIAGLSAEEKRNQLLVK